MTPAIILVRPQLGMNIGMTARAMANFGLADLRLVSPRDGWPNPDAGPAAAGADAVLAAVTVHDSIASALADCTLTFATTVRPRGLAKPVLTPREGAARMRSATSAGLRAGILFGPERSGLAADDIAPVETILTCPVSPSFTSLNLAQAVLVVAYEWYQSGLDPAPAAAEEMPRASHGEVAGLVAQLDSALDAAGFYHVAARTPTTRRMLAHMFSRHAFSSEEIRTLRGMIRALGGRPPASV